MSGVLHFPPRGMQQCHKSRAVTLAEWVPREREASELGIFTLKQIEWVNKENR